MSELSGPILGPGRATGKQRPSLREDDAIPMADLGDDASQRDVASFKTKHGKGFFVLWTADHSLNRSPELGSREWRKSTQVVATDGTDESSLAMRPSDFFVYPIRSKRGDGGTMSLGRSHTCDVWMDDLSVSTHHAELELDAYGGLQITDRDSTNGTYVGNEHVEFGETANVPFGKTVRFGSVRLTYMPAEQLVEFIALMMIE